MPNVIRACKEGIGCLQGSSIAPEQADACRESRHVEMVERAITILEDDPHLNAGLLTHAKWVPLVALTAFQ